MNKYLIQDLINRDKMYNSFRILGESPYYSKIITNKIHNAKTLDELSEILIMSNGKNKYQLIFDKKDNKHIFIIRKVKELEIRIL